MACVLKIPTNTSKGILSFTSRENEEFIVNNKSMHKRLEILKKDWFIGLHHNWHNFKLYPDKLYDFHMAGETDLISIGDQPFCHIPIECTHFTQDYFKFIQNEKMWDILYVGKAVNFKKIPEFFKIIRHLYNEGKMYRVLFIAPIPPACKKNRFNPNYFCNIRKVYNEMFTIEERKLFNLLTMDYEYPFPFDLGTLSHFYKSSRIFVFTSDDERRPRTVAYAMATGMPTVLMESVASLMPKHKQIKPFVYLANSYKDYPHLIEEAISFTKSSIYTKEAMREGINEFNAEYNLNRLRDSFLNLFQVNIYEYEKNNSILYDLDIRLARHYGFGEDGHSVGWKLTSFVTYLEKRTFKEMKLDIKQNLDFERDISNLVQYGEKEYKSTSSKVFKQILIAMILPIYHKSDLLQKVYKIYKDK